MAEITSVTGLARLILWLDAPAMPAAEAAFGVPIPRQASRAETIPPRAVLWLGPDEFLLLLPEADVQPVITALVGALAPHPHALVDISHRQLALRVVGPGAACLLSTGCPLDLDLTAFPVGTCTRTLLGKSEIVLWRTGAQAFHLEIARSYLPYVETYLNEAILGLS